MTNPTDWIIIGAYYEVLPLAAGNQKPPCAENGAYIPMFETVKELLVSELKVNADAIKPEAELFTDLGLNSIDLATLLEACEEKYNLTIDDEVLNKIITVNDMVEFLENAK